MASRENKILTPSEKQQAWQLIQSTLQRECRKFLDTTWRYIGSPMDDGADAVHQRYIGLYERVRNFDRLIGHYYDDDITGSDFVPVLARLYRDKILSDEDLPVFSRPVQDTIKEEAAAL